MVRKDAVPTNKVEEIDWIKTTRTASLRILARIMHLFLSRGGRCSTPDDFVAAVENLCIVRPRGRHEALLTVTVDRPMG